MKPTENRLREAVEQYGPSVVRECRAFTADRHLADDLAQEVFSRICEVVAKPSRDREDIPWKLVEGIMRNVFLEHLRQKKKWPVLNPEMEAIPENANETTRQLEDENGIKLRIMLEKLSIPEQQVVIGRHFLGMNIADLTRFLGLPRSTVVDCYNRGLARLKEMARDHGLLP